ncbi:hypothetical protein T484DRAFT_2450792 [Baffinella frigidus]|nr:hypothetical protein T484DRAFT_2450792 [Cryptophyta sp. CCMP2293]
MHQVFVRINEEKTGVQGVPRLPIFGQVDGRSGCRPVLEVKNQGKVIYSSLMPEDGAASVGPPRFYIEGDDEVMQWRVGRTLLGGVTVTCYHVELQQDDIELPGLGTQTAWTDDNVDKSIIFRYACNTGFVDTESRGGLVQLYHSDLDVLPSRSLSGGQSVPEDLIVDLIFLEVKGDDRAVDYDISLFPGKLDIFVHLRSARLS